MAEKDIQDPLAEFQKALDNLSESLTFNEADASVEGAAPEDKGASPGASPEDESAYYDRLNSPRDGSQDEPTDGSEEDHMGLTQMGLAHGRAVPGSQKTFP